MKDISEKISEDHFIRLATWSGWLSKAGGDSRLSNFLWQSAYFRTNIYSLARLHWVWLVEAEEFNNRERRFGVLIRVFLDYLSIIL